MDNQYIIKIFSEMGQVTHVDLQEKPLIIGRSAASSNVVIDDPRISRVHLEVIVAPDGTVMVMDLDTANGSVMDGKLLIPKEAVEWLEGKELTIGKTRLTLQRGSTDAEAHKLNLQDAQEPSIDTLSRSDDSEPNRRSTMEMQILSQETSLLGRLLNALGMVLVLALSLGLLGYVGFGEASRTFPTFEMDKLGAQGETIKNSMGTALIAGVPLEQFPGFVPLTQPILDSDASIVSIYATDPNGQIVHANVRSRSNAFDETAPPTFAVSTLNKKDSPFEVTESEGLYRVSIELPRKFETQPTGTLHVTLLKSVITERINQAFINVGIVAGVVLGVFALYVIIDVLLAARGRKIGRRLLNLAYGLAFVVMAGFVILTLINLYSEGIQGKTQALANALAQRLDAPLRLGLDITDTFTDLNAVFEEYKSNNPDLSYVSLTSDEAILIDLDTTRIGQAWQLQPNTFETRVKLEGDAVFADADLELRLGVPTNAVYSRLWSSVKNFVVLFVAAGLLSLLFFNLMQTFLDRSALHTTDREKAIAAQQNALLDIINPFYFLAVFAEGLASSFLPQYMKGVAVQSGVDPNTVSTLFTVYFLAFVIALIPAGMYAERRGVKPLMVLGNLLVGLSLVLLAFTNDFYLMFVIRALAGLGQGVLLIGVQSYILEVATGGRKTQGAAIIVFGYNGGMISGTAIGALLVVYMQPRGVFIMGAVTALFGLLYALTLIPRMLTTDSEADKTEKQGFFRSLRNAASDFEFLKAMIFIGIPAKAILTGVTIFALPLLLARQNYPQEDIGQIIMLYAGGVLISSSYISRLVDRIGKTTAILFFGTLGSGIGLVLIGMAGLQTWAGEPIPAEFKTIVLIIGMIVLGLSHGFINAPIVTHVSTTTAADVLGKSSATSLYRLLERIGHVSGPMIVGQLLFFSGESLLAMSILGMVTILFGILFLVRFNWGARRPSEPRLKAST
jgi:MFS family permease